MAEIQPVVYPLNIGVANQLSIKINSSSETDGARIFYHLSDSNQGDGTRLSASFLVMSHEDFTNHGNDEEWVLNYVANQLGVTLI
jgi:hypothetical protein